MSSPYDGVAVEQWSEVTQKLVRQHPLTTETLVTSVLEAWQQIFESSIGTLRIGQDIFPQPQIMGFFLHELVPVVVARHAPGWRRGNVGAYEKDLHFDENPLHSVEIKTSSNPRQIFGNRSYAQAGVGLREKAGYYLAVNFVPFGARSGRAPQILRVRFGWLDHADWIGQVSQTGQQARLTRDADRYKLLDLLLPGDA